MIARALLSRPRINLAAVALAFASSMAWGQSCPLNVQEVGSWNQDSGDYSEIWAEGDVAFMGQFGFFGANGVFFFDISDPTNPIMFREWNVGSPNQFASAQDVKSGDGMLFISLESDNNDGVEIVDIRDPFNPVHLSWIRTPSMEAVHDTFYNSGFLYICNSGTPEVSIVDLRNFDFDNPPVRITQDTWHLNNVGVDFVHDINVSDGILYACAWDSGLYLYDVSNIATQAPAFLGSGTGDNTHAVWPSDNGRWAVVGEERSNGPLKLYEIIPNGGGMDVIERDSISRGDATSMHNPVVVGTRVYAAWYQAGLRILDIDEDNARLVDLGGYDTFGGGGGGFNGAWGVYPFLGEDRLLVSDLSNGLFVIDAQLEPLTIDYPNGRVMDVDPVEGAILTVFVDSACGQPDPETGRVHIEINGAVDAVEAAFTLVGDDLYEAQLPGAPCGADYSYYVSFDTLGGDTILDPPGAPANTYTAAIFSSIDVRFADDFEVENAWTAESFACDGVDSPTGNWERVDPIGTGAAPEDDFSANGEFCFVTQQGEPGGFSGEADVDGGPFRLISPAIELGGSDALVRYARWFTTSGDDEMTVELTGNEGASWFTVEFVEDAGTQWVLHEFMVSDIVAGADSVRLRFTVEDCPNNSLTEAAIDDVSFTVLECVDDSVPPAVVHDSGVSTSPYSGYIDPRRESDDGVSVNQGITTVSITFTEPVRNIGGGPLDATAFELTTTGAAIIGVASIEAVDSPTIVITLDAPLAPGSWYTLTASVEDMVGNAIENQGNLGPATDEPDRVDIAFLPADIDQDGTVGPFDVLRFRQYVTETAEPEQGVVADFADINRGGTVDPFDLLTLRQLVNGVTPATQSWSGVTLDSPRP